MTLIVLAPAFSPSDLSLRSLLGSLFKKSIYHHVTLLANLDFHVDSKEASRVQGAKGGEGRLGQVHVYMNPHLHLDTTETNPSDHQYSKLN